jgi:heme A synthase
VRQSLDVGLRVLFLGLFVVVAFVVTWRARTFRRALTAWGWVALAAVVAQGWFWPWYVSWAIVPATFAPSRRLRKATIVFSVSALLLYVEEQVLSPHFKLFFDWSGVFVMAPPLVYILFSWLAEARRRRRAGRLPARREQQPVPEAAGQPELVH